MTNSASRGKPRIDDMIGITTDSGDTENRNQAFVCIRSFIRRLVLISVGKN